MRTVPSLLLVACLSTGLIAQTATQSAPKPAPAQPKPAPPAPAPGQAAPAPAPARPAAPRAAAARLSLLIFVSDTTGEPAPGVSVSLTGPMNREGTTGDNGQIRFQGLRAGTYRARFAGPKWIGFEKEITVRAGAPNETDATLTVAPPPPPPPAAPASAPPPPSSRALPPAAEATSTDIATFIEKNYISGRQPQKENDLACSGDGRAVLLQIRDPLENRSHDDYDEFLYVVAGDGTLRLDGREVPLTGANGTFALVPRGATYSLTRKGRNPLMLLSIRAGVPCR